MRLRLALALSLTLSLPALAAEPQTGCGDPFTKATLAGFSPAAVVGPRIEAKPALQIVGREGAFDANSDAYAIDRLWFEVNRKDNDWIKDRVDEDAFGVCFGADASGRFHYLAGKEVTGAAAPPEETTTMLVPARTYAVFTYKGIALGIADARHLIYAELLPNAGLKPLAAPEVESFGAHYWATSPLAVMEIWVPVEQ
jgi:AraC family transcriptional regulator